MHVIENWSKRDRHFVEIIKGKKKKNRTQLANLSVLFDFNITSLLLVDPVISN